MAASRAKVLAGYRSLLRTMNAVFAKDLDALQSARSQARQMLQENIALQEASAIGEGIRNLQEAEEFIRTSIVMAELNDEGAYAMAVEDRHLGRDSPHTSGVPVPAWIRVGEAGISLDVHVQPGASSTEWCGQYSPSRAKVRIATRPEDGKANTALLTFVAESMAVDKSAVSLVRGRSSREKTVEIEGITADHALRVVGYEPELPEARGPGLQLQSAIDAATGKAKDPGACGCSDHNHEHEELGTAIRV